MKTKFGLAGAAVLAIIAAVLVAIQPAQAAVGIRVSNGVLVEANGTPLKLRGINHAHTWYPSQTSSFANIKAPGANTVRVVLSGGRVGGRTAPPTSPTSIILCKANRLICVLEVHDTTGYGEQSGAVTLDQAVDYWISVQSALAGQENYVILNIGNEPFGNNSAVSPNWTAATTAARSSGCAAPASSTPIMVDAPNWGQDWAFIMRDNAPTVLRRRPDRQHHLLDPHVRRVRHRRRGQRLPRLVHAAANLPIVRRRVRRQPLRRQPRRGRHHGQRPGRRHRLHGLVVERQRRRRRVPRHGDRLQPGPAQHLGQPVHHRRQRAVAPPRPRRPSTAATPTATPRRRPRRARRPRRRHRHRSRPCPGRRPPTTSASPATTSTAPPAPPAAPSPPSAPPPPPPSPTPASPPPPPTATRSAPATPPATPPPSPPPSPSPPKPAAATPRPRPHPVRPPARASPPRPRPCPGRRPPTTSASPATTSTAPPAPPAAPSPPSAPPPPPPSPTPASPPPPPTATRSAPATPPATPPPSPPPSPSPPKPAGGTGGCSASYTQIGGNWPGGFQGEVRVTNTGTTATTGWTVVVTFANGQRITQIWSGRTTSTASPYTVTNESYNGALGANAFTTFGFLGSWTGSNTAPTLTCTRTP